MIYALLKPHQPKIPKPSPLPPTKQSRPFRELTPLAFHPNTDRTFKQMNSNRHKHYDVNHMERHQGKNLDKVHVGYLVPTNQNKNMY